MLVVEKTCKNLLSKALRSTLPLTTLVKRSLPIDSLHDRGQPAPAARESVKGQEVAVEVAQNYCHTKLPARFRPRLQGQRVGNDSLPLLRNVEGSDQQFPPHRLGKAVVLPSRELVPRLVANDSLPYAQPHVRTLFLLDRTVCTTVWGTFAIDGIFVGRFESRKKETKYLLGSQAALRPPPAHQTHQSP
jgi:hypothetical protein